MKTTLLTFTTLIFLTHAGLTASVEVPPGTQTVRGTIVDDQTLMPIPAVTIIVIDSDPLLGTITDLDGKFRFTSIPVGRVGFILSMVSLPAGVRLYLLIKNISITTATHK